MELSPQEIERIEREVMQYPEHVRERYWDMVANGQSPRFAIMCACQQAPMTKYSDKTFNAERQLTMRKMHPKQQAAYLAMAKKAGISTQGKFYVGGLGRPTDPAAWVSTVDDAVSVCKAKNLTADGLFHHKGHDVPPPKKKPLAKDIVNRLVEKKLAGDPGLASACQRDPSHIQKVAREVRDRHSSSCNP